MLYFLGVWGAVTCFISPIWLTMIYLDLTGLIYQYDFSMDEGMAGILGILSMAIWIVLVLVPDIILLKKVYVANRRHLCIVLGFAAVIVCVCLTMCHWNVIAFLTTPGGL